jgi:predicted transcriptional regulator
MDQNSINTLNSGQILQKKTRSILDELAHLPVSRDRENLVESRATHVISGAINLINYIKENYDEEQAAELERRLLNSIRSQDPAKFSRGVRRFKNDN